MRIVQMLDISTSHLPEAQHRDLTIYGEIDGVTIRELPHGWLMWIPEDPADYSAQGEEPVPDEILAIQIRARELGCDWVMFDADADEDDALPTYPSPDANARGDQMGDPNDTSETDGAWWCRNCAEEVDSSRVTFQERHDSCGFSVLWVQHEVTG